MNSFANPLSDVPATESEDLEAVRRAQAGSREALEQLITRHQPWIYNIVVRMIYLPADAEDATQEILIKLLTRLSTFEGRSSFRTWLYRIACNHVLNMQRRRIEQRAWTFAEYKDGIETAGDEDLPDTAALPADVQLLMEEAKIGCTTGMLLCLDREQRLVYILGHIFGVTDTVGGELLEISRDSFRQKLSRARRDLHHFMDGQCGLVNPANPCRCARKARGFMRAGYLDPANLLFARSHVVRVRDVTERTCEGIEDLDAAYAEIHRGHPFLEPKDLAASLRGLFERPEFKTLIAPEWKE
jgi:RNA polymerase sigma factor (sigma-70 family)